MKKYDIKDVLFMISVGIFLVAVFVTLGLKIIGMDTKFLWFPGAVMFVALGMTFGVGIFDICATNLEQKKEQEKENADEDHQQEDPS